MQYSKPKSFLALSTTLPYLSLWCGQIPTRHQTSVDTRTAV